MSHYINLPLSGLEPPLSEMEQFVQDTAHRFAEEVLRPAGPIVDEMPADKAIARRFAEEGAPTSLRHSGVEQC